MRLDQFLVKEGYYESREKAKRAIMAGEVEVLKKGKPLKPGDKVGDEKLEIKQRQGPRFVSRGGEKLDNALELWGMEVKGKSVLDIGSSTGGFTDCLLKRGADRVIALDVGSGLLHWKLRNDQRVYLMEGTNARHLESDHLPFMPELVCVDVSFISLRLIFQALNRILPVGITVIALVKPQFEAGRKSVGKGGIVRDPGVHKAVIEDLVRDLEGLGFYLHSLCEAIPCGKHGNKEFFSLWVKGLPPSGARQPESA